MSRHAKVIDSDLDRVLDCELSIEDDFLNLVGKGLSSGWSPAETCSAIAALVGHFEALMLIEDETVRKLIELLADVRADTKVSTASASS